MINPLDRDGSLIRSAARRLAIIFCTAALLGIAHNAVAETDETKWPAGGAHNLLYRLAPHAMGQNNGISLWVRGDGGDAVLRIRLMTIDPDNVSADTAMLRPTWVSTPIKIHATEWKHVVLPRSKFTFHGTSDTPDSDDILLPADAQSGLTDEPEQPKFANVNAVVLETSVAGNSVIGVDDINWIDVDDAGSIRGTASVDDFEAGNLAAWTVLGDADQRQPLTYSMNTTPDWVHGGRVAFKLNVVSPASRRKSLLLPGANRVMAVSQKPYLVFLPPSLFTEVLPSTLAEPGGTSSTVSVQLCPDQIQAATFCIYSRKPMYNVTVSVADSLYGIGHTLSKASVDVTVVKVWNQLGNGPLRNPDDAGPTPELLVKDDRQALSGISPAVRLTGDVQTDIPADSTKQFWLTITAPRNAAPDEYTGKLIVKAAGMAPFSVSLDVKVLPLRLLNPAKQYAIDLRTRLDSAPDTLPSADGSAFVTDYEPRNMLDKQLADIVAHGVKYVSVHDSASTFWDAYTARANAGFLPPFVYQGPSDPMKIEAERAEHHGPAFIYYQDPSPGGQQEIQTIAAKGLPSATYIVRQSDYAALQGSLDTAIYNRDGDYPQELIRTHGKRTSTKHDWWYWQATNEDPHANRYSAGYLLERAHLYGAFIPAYQLAFGSDPYDEMSAGAAPVFAHYRPEMLTYPAANGVIDTVQWEAIREGINDDRYLTTMYAALRECKDAHVAKSVAGEAEAYVAGFLDKPIALLSDVDYQAARAKISGYAVKLRSAVDAYNKAHPSP